MPQLQHTQCRRLKESIEGTGKILMAISSSTSNKKNNSSYSSAAVAEPPKGTGSRGSARRAASDNSLSRRFGITEQNLNMRRKFLRLDELDREFMIEMIPWAKSVAADVAREFYEWQFNFEPTLEFFEAHCE